MENYKKEQSSRQHLKIEVVQDQAQDELFTNSMIYGDRISPTSPRMQTQLHNSGTTSSNPGTPTTNHTSGITRTIERLSLKSKSKNQSFFKFFGRGQGSTSSNGGGGQVTNTVSGRNSIVAIGGKRTFTDTEEFGADGSSGSDHEDPFSSSGGGELSAAQTHQSDPPKSPASNAEACGMLHQLAKRHHSREHCFRDSGFSSERESVSYVKITPQSSINPDDDRSSPSDGGVYQAAAMEALEILHDQLQLLVKRDSDMPTDSEVIFEQIIDNLSKRLDDQEVVLNQQRLTETNLRLSLRVAEQRLMEVETELGHMNERCVNAERKYFKMASKYSALKSKKMEGKTSAATTPPIHCRIARVITAQKNPRSSLPVPLSGHTPYHLPLQVNGHNSSHPRSPFTRRSICHSPSPVVENSSKSSTQPLRARSQTLYDRLNTSTEFMSNSTTERPSTTQGFHTDAGNAHMTMGSLSHTETCV